MTNENCGGDFKEKWTHELMTVKTFTKGKSRGWRGSSTSQVLKYETNSY